MLHSLVLPGLHAAKHVEPSLVTNTNPRVMRLFLETGLIPILVNQIAYCAITRVGIMGKCLLNLLAGGEDTLCSH